MNAFRPMRALKSAHVLAEFRANGGRYGNLLNLRAHQIVSVLAVIQALLAKCP
jgi:hypothetical protein